MSLVEITDDAEVIIVQEDDIETIVVLSPDDVETIAVGDQGPPGPPGPAGPASTVPGPVGPKGDLGPPGPQGIQGVPGPLGGTFSDAPSDGQTYGRKNAAWQAFTGGGGGGATVLVGDTAPVGAPSNALWWQSSTGLAFINYFDGDSTQWTMFQYAVPGPLGPQGIQGNQGPPGPSGIQGPPGSASTVPGPAGPQGDKGDTGSQGPQGIQGNTGPAGAPSTVPGPQGIQGPQGDVGPPGPKGDKGDQGNVGPAGPAGAGSGNVNGPAGAVANDIVVFDGVTGTLIKDSGITIAALAPLASPTFTGDPKAPTPAAGDNDTSVATTEFVNTAIAAAGTGQIFYLDLTDAADVSGYKRMLLTPSAGAENSLSAVATGTTADFLIGSFITDVGIPGAIQFPAGSAYRRLYGKVSGGTAKFHLQVYIRSAAGVETLARDEFSNDFTDTVATLQEWLATPPASGALATTDRLVAKISARRVTGPTNVTVTLYGEGNAHASQIQTTISPTSSVPISATPPLSITGGNISINLSAYAPLTYVDAADALKVAKAGDTMTGPLIVTPKGSMFGGPAGNSAVSVAPADANIKLYDVGGGNWAGVGADANGIMWFRTGASGTPLPLLTLSPDQIARFAQSPLVPNVAAADNSTKVPNTAFLAANDVRVDMAQAFTTAQREQARKNIAAAPFDALAYNGMQINGAMEIDQQWCGNTVFTGGATYAVDQWVAGANPSVNSMYTQRATNAPPGYNNSLMLKVNTVLSSVNAADFAFLVNYIEGTRVARLAWGTANAQPVTLGFWVQAHRPGTYSGSMRNYAGNRSYPFNFTINAADTWEFKVLTIPGDTAAGTWSKDASGFLYLSFVMHCVNASILAPAGAWGANNAVGATGTFSGATTAGDQLFITGVIFLPGLELPPVERMPLIMRPADQELITCKRYFEKSYGLATPIGTVQAPAPSFVNDTGGPTIYIPVHFQVEKRATPGVTSYGYSTGNPGQITSSANVDTAATVDVIGTNGCRIWGAGNGFAYCHWVANGR